MLARALPSPPRIDLNCLPSCPKSPTRTFQRPLVPLRPQLQQRQSVSHSVSNVPVPKCARASLCPRTESRHLSKGNQSLQSTRQPTDGPVVVPSEWFRINNSTCAPLFLPKVLSLESPSTSLLFVSLRSILRNISKSGPPLSADLLTSFACTLIFPP